MAFNGAELEAQAHKVLGLVATKTNRAGEAIVEMEKAALNNPVPQGWQFYRIDLLYRQNSGNAQAENAFRRDAALGPQVIVELVARQLKDCMADHH